MNITRRGLLGSSAALIAAPALAQARKLDVLSHRVHQAVLTQGAAGDLTEAWRRSSNTEVSWTTMSDNGPLMDRLLREASLPQTDFSVGYLLNSRATAQTATLLEPLDDLLRSAPIDRYDDIAPGLRGAMQVGGKTIGIPVRHATNGLFYNAEMLEQAGIAAPPRTFEELIDQCRRVSGRRGDGPPVTGLVMTASLAAYPVIFARAFGGDFITEDFRLLPDRGAMVNAIAAIRGLFEANALPRNYASITNEDQATYLMQGRSCFAILPFARHAQLNRADQSRFPGKINAIEVPVSATAPAGTRMSTVVEFWAMSIPKASRDKATGWSFIRAMSSPEVTLGAARNGNGPVRVSTYAEAAFAATNPVAATEAAALSRARIPFPAFPEANRAEAIFMEEVQSAVLGRKTPAQAVDDTATRVRPLLPA